MPPTSLRVEVQARLTRAYQDMAGRDLESLMTLYAPDALIQSAGARPVVGAASIRRFWEETLARYEVQLVPELEEARQEGALVFVRGSAAGSFAPRDGSAPLQTHVWLHQVYLRTAEGALVFWRGANGALAD